MRALIALLLLAMVGPGLAAELVVLDGDTFQLDRTIYRLDGIDAPEIDQTCLDQRGDVWPCGVTGRLLRCTHRLRAQGQCSNLTSRSFGVNQFTPIIRATKLVCRMRGWGDLGDGQEKNRSTLRRDRKLIGRGVAHQRLAHL